MRDQDTISTRSRLAPSDRPTITVAARSSRTGGLSTPERGRSTCRGTIDRWAFPAGEPTGKLLTRVRRFEGHDAVVQCGHEPSSSPRWTSCSGASRRNRLVRSTGQHLIRRPGVERRRFDFSDASPAATTGDRSATGWHSGRGGRLRSPSIQLTRFLNAYSRRVGGPLETVKQNSEKHGMPDGRYCFRTAGSAHRPGGPISRSEVRLDGRGVPPDRRGRGHTPNGVLPGVGDFIVGRYGTSPDAGRP